MKIISVEVETASDRFRMNIHLDKISAVQEIEKLKSYVWIKGKTNPVCVAESYASLLKRIREISNGR